MNILLLVDTGRVADWIDQELQRHGLAPVLWRVDSAAGLAQALKELHWDMEVSAPMGEQEAMAMMQIKAHQDRLALEEALASFKAAVSNMPGMVFEMEFAADGTSTLITVSEGARDLFHTTPELLMQDPDAIGSRVVPEDMTLFLQSRKAAFLMQVDWNWTGRIHIAEMNEIKWIDLRSKVRRRADTSTCWDGIILNITRSRVADIKARRAHEELARLTKHVDTVEQQQRSHIAREIHDELGEIGRASCRERVSSPV